MYSRKGLITGNIHVKYQSSTTHCSKVISKVKVFQKWVKLKGQGHRLKNNGTHGKVLSQEIFMWNIKALALSVQKLLVRLKFQRGGQNDRQDKNNVSPIFYLGGIKRFFECRKVKFLIFVSKFKLNLSPLSSIE